MPDENQTEEQATFAREHAAATVRAAKSAADTVRGLADGADSTDVNPFGDIGHPTQVQALQLRAFGTDKARAIADAIEAGIKANDTSLLPQIAGLVVQFSGLPLKLLEALTKVPALGAVIAAL